VDTAQVVTEFDQCVAPKYQRKENNFILMFEKTLHGSDEVA